MSGKRNIPEEIKREVRQRCGFGCVICGIPIYEYHHIIDWAKVHKHEVENITLLCDKHHREYTSRLLPLEMVIEANKRPHNIVNGISSSYLLHYSGSHFEVIMGSVKYIAGDRKDYLYQAILVDMNPLIGFRIKDGNILLFLRVYDNENRLLLYINDNELIYKAELWDIEFTGNNLIIREGSRKILIDILFKTPNTVVIQRGRLTYNGVYIFFSKDELVMGKYHFKYLTIKGLAGFVLGIGPNPDFLGGIHYPEIQRYNHIPI